MHILHIYHKVNLWFGKKVIDFSASKKKSYITSYQQQFQQDLLLNWFDVAVKFVYFVAEL